MTLRLNGWQRLWVVVSILYLLPVVGIALLVWPTAAATSHREEFLERLPADVRSFLVAAYRSEWEAEKARVAREAHIQWDDDQKTLGKRKQLLPQLTGDISKDLQARGTFLLEFPNGAILYVRPSATFDSPGRAEAAYWRVVKAETRAARWTTAWQVALAWVTPCLALYALGWAVAWIRRGFRKSKSAPVG